MIDKKVSKYFSKLAKESHKKHPRTREFFQEIGTKGSKKRWNKLSTPSIGE